ncbi:hypothetical protein, partial [Phascolarctobacterium sp.]|uniref:hypothetical protein n=1 Tax=Phascolarctobacterium sp. TaxID=2049039 RepID=UPI0025E5EF82
LSIQEKSYKVKQNSENIYVLHRQRCDASSPHSVTIFTPSPPFAEKYFFLLYFFRKKQYY